MEAIKANELRIGNFVGQGLLHTGIGGYDHYTVRELHETVCFFNESDTGEYYKDFKPIPLTEDWLIRSGFEKIQYSYQQSYKLDDVEIWLINGKLLQDNDREVKSVHQLQNLYFALTGTELTLKN